MTTNSKVEFKQKARDRLKYLAKLELARRDYGSYFMLANEYRYAMMKHTRYLCDQMNRVINQGNQFYLISMPPQTGKSLTLTKTFPSYWLMNNPDKEAIVATYSDELANKFGRANRAKIAAYAGELYGVELSHQKATSTTLTLNKHSGSMLFTTISGQLTGNGADLLIIDDPTKGFQDAQSKLKQERLWDSWSGELFSRFHPGGSIIVIATRWDKQDLIGQLKAKTSLPWKEIRIPALAEEDDVLGRNVGDPLAADAPLNRTAEWWDNVKHSNSAQVWASLYQQRPTIKGGNVFKQSYLRYWVHSYDELQALGLENDPNTKVIPPETLRPLEWTSWDLAFSGKETADFTAGQTWSADGDQNYYMVDYFHQRVGFPEQVQAILNMSAKHPKANMHLVEAKANGQAVLDTIATKVAGITPVKPSTDKESRANAMIGTFASGHIFIPHPRIAPWINDYIEELLSFPNAPHDDSVDSTTQAINFKPSFNNDDDDGASIDSMAFF